MNLLVRNLSIKIAEKELLQIFQKIGKVLAHNIVMDKDTGRSKGFGFVEMLNDYEALAAIKALNGKRIGGQIIRVKKAVKSVDRPVVVDRPVGNEDKPIPAGRAHRDHKDPRKTIKSIPRTTRGLKTISDKQN